MKDDEDYVWLTPISEEFLSKDYLSEGETVDGRVDAICKRAEKLLKIKGYAKKLKKYIKKGWYSLSSPIWANFGKERGLPISCFGSFIEDDTESILDTVTEVGMMTKHGGGTSAGFGQLRSRGSPIRGSGESAGAVHFMQMFDTSIGVISQGRVRRGSFAAYLPIEHPDIMEFLTIKHEGSSIQDISYGVTVTNKWLQSMIDGDYDKRVIWAKALDSRFKTGYPYIIFIDNVNDNTVDVYKDLKMWISQSNLCTEIFLPNNKDESFVCDLSSMNILYYDDWKDTDAVEVLTFLLDAVMSEFILKARKIKSLKRAVRFAKRHRAIGIGWLGYHSYLQSKMIPFESMKAKLVNVQIAKNIKKAAYAASAKLASIFGEPELLKGYGRRNTTLTANAPTKSSAWIIGQASESAQPEVANIVVKDLAKGKYTHKNKYLEALLESKGLNTKVIWDDIRSNGGSVQHLQFLTQQEKDVFKTFIEINPMEIIIQAAQRQKYIDQGQSLNLMIDPNIPFHEYNQLILEAWRMGVWSLYYHISVNAAQQLSRNLLACKSCEA